MGWFFSPSSLSIGFWGYELTSNGLVTADTSVIKGLNNVETNYPAPYRPVTSVAKPLKVLPIWKVNLKSAGSEQGYCNKVSSAGFGFPGNIKRRRPVCRAPFSRLARGRGWLKTAGISRISRPDRRNRKPPRCGLRSYNKAIERYNLKIGRWFHNIFTDIFVVIRKPFLKTDGRNGKSTGYQLWLSNGFHDFTHLIYADVGCVQQEVPLTPRENSRIVKYPLLRLTSSEIRVFMPPAAMHCRFCVFDNW